MDQQTIKAQEANRAAVAARFERRFGRNPFAAKKTTWTQDEDRGYHEPTFRADTLD
jgi:hypothetical protein